MRESIPRRGTKKMATRNGHFDFMFLPDQIKVIPNSMIVLGEHFYLKAIAGADPGF